MTYPLRAAILAAGMTALAARADIELKYIDPSVKPQDDFFSYVNGTWVRETEIPPQYSRWGSFSELAVRNQDALRTLCEAAAAKGAAGDDIERRVGDFYASGMDEASINAAGAKPLAPEMDRITAIATPADVMAEIAHLQSLGMSAAFRFGPGPDAKDSGMDIAQLVQGGMSLPDRDYYLKDDERTRKIRAGFVEHVSHMFVLLGDFPEIANVEAAAILKLETSFAQASLAREALRDPYASYHKVTVASLPEVTGTIDWKAFFAGVGAPPFSEVNLAEPEFFRAFAHLLETVSIGDWKAYLKWRLIHECGAYLSQPFVDESFAYYGRTLSGTPELRPRWQRVAMETDGSIGEALGRLYVAKYFPPESKARVLDLVAQLRANLRERLQTLAWMDEATRAKAVAKLDLLRVKMGYPDKWSDYSSLQTDRGAFVWNVLHAGEFEQRRDMAKIGKPVDAAEWRMTTPTVNAYYSPPRNEIVFPAGILQPPFYDAHADDAVNYGGIGAVIGHEMTHGFDDQGRQYDGHGNLSDWWTAESTARFKARAAGIVKQFSDYTVLDGLHLIGERVQGENIADLGGLKIAYAAMEKAAVGHPREKLYGFTPEQRFFVSYGTIWRDKIRPEELRLRVKTDPHSPARFRVNGPLSNLDEFAAAFDVPEGAPMRRPESDRVNIW